MEQNGTIRQQVLTGVVWKFTERILAQVISLCVSIILARLLDPSDYGVVSIVTVFFAFANVIISGGLNTALIQKKDADRDDYNTVFTVSFVVSIVIYAVLFCVAPRIAELYDQKILVDVIRVLGLSLPIYALKSIVCAYVSANMQFKMFFLATLGGTLASAVVGISLALNGFGAWALVAQQLTNTAIDTLILFAVTKLRLSFKIVVDRFRVLIGYSSKILASSLLGITFTQINPLFIGLKYTNADLSFYTKGRSIPEMLSSSVSNTISAVLFPALAKCQDDKARVLQYTRLYMRLSSFVVFPAMLGFFAISENFVRIFLTDKWLPAVHYMQIASVATMFDMVAIGNCEAIKAMGRSDIYLKIEIAKKSGYFITLALFLLLTNSPQALALSLVVCTVIQITINSIPNRKLIGYKGVYQMSDLLPNLIPAVLMCWLVMLIGKLTIEPVLLLIVQIIAGGIIYILLAFVTKNKSLLYIFNLIKRKETRSGC